VTTWPTAILRSLGETDEGRLPESLYAASPDGSRLAYVVTGDDGTPQIFIANIDGTGVRQMTHDPVGAGSPGWSPDGASVAFQGFGGGQVQNLFVIDVATGAITQITHEDDDSLWTPTFTPDGASLLYTGGPNEAPVLRTVPIAGGESTLLIGPEGDAVGDLTDAANGSMSPDGSMVAFTGSQVVSPGPGHWVANTDGSERRSIPCQWLAPAGSWSPDGTRIACRGSADTWSTDGGVLGRITVVDVATGDAWRVADGASAIWLDDHTLLVEA
jgi:Tol biopolymer transport system component